jgi:ATP-dependent Lon protease
MKQVIKTMVARLGIFTMIKYKNYAKKLGLSFLLLGLGLGLSSCRNNSAIMEELEQLRIEVEAATKEAQEAKRLANQLHEKEIHQTASTVNSDTTKSSASADNQPSDADIDKKIKDAVQDALNRANIEKRAEKAVEEAIDKATIDQKVQKEVDEKMNAVMEEAKSELQELQKRLGEVSTALDDTLKNLQEQDMFSNLGNKAQETFNNIKDKFKGFFSNQ